jgi:adenylosuccinate lyase
MAALFSARRRVQTWRQIWVALAESQAELGIGGVTTEQVAALKEAIDQVDFDRAEELERELRHDVMAHIRTYGEAAPLAAGVIHLGATSAFVVDNGDLLIMREALHLVERKALCVVKALAEFAESHADRPTLAWTHFQPAQPTTVGKRACMWIADLMFDLDEIRYRLDSFRLRGIKGTTGTQASFMALTDGDAERVDALEDAVVEKLAADGALPITGQTYSRRVDAAWAATLTGIAQSASKFSYDMRLLQHLGEVLEPFGKQQVGSSAMAYKRNPIRAERMSGLSRLALQTGANLAHTAATQWLERSLDDSANKRIAIPELFLTIDALLILYYSVARGLQVSEAVIARHLADEVPTMASENLLMAAVAAGGDRQALHERVRVCAREAAEQVAVGGTNDLLTRLASEEGFAELPPAVWEAASDPAALVGRAPEQTRRFLRGVVRPRLESYPGELEMAGDVRV